MFSAGISNHEKRSHSTKVLSCPSCDYVTHVEKALKMHMDTQHQGVKAYACPAQCGYSTGYSGNLPKHTKRCAHYTKLYNSVWDPASSSFVCPGAGCHVTTASQQVFFKHYKHCDKVHKTEPLPQASPPNQSVQAEVLVETVNQAELTQVDNQEEALVVESFASIVDVTTEDQPVGESDSPTVDLAAVANRALLQYQASQVPQVYQGQMPEMYINIP